MPPDEQERSSTSVSTPEATELEPDQSSPGSVTEGGDGRGQGPPPLSPGQGPPPAPSARRGGRGYVAVFAALAVLAACAIGVGLGYAVFRSTTPTTTPTTSPPTTTPVTSPKVAAIAAKVNPGVVNIDTTLAYQTAAGAGTGMVATSSGEVFTNNHVINGATSLHVTDVGNGKTYAATVVGYDIAHDVAVLQLTGASHLRTVSFASTPAKIGQVVVAVGNAGGKGGTPSAVSGVVTGLDQSITARDELSGTTEQLSGLIETNAPIQAGDSGGPLVNTAARVLGMNTAGSSRFDFSQGTIEGYAIPIGTVRAIGAQIERGESSSTVHIGPTAFLGVETTNVGTTGALVVSVLPGTPATAVGLIAGDTIVSLGGQVIRSPTTLSDVLQAETPGATIPIGWQSRVGQSYTATVTLASGPPA